MYDRGKHWFCGGDGETRRRGKNYCMIGEDDDCVKQLGGNLRQDLSEEIEGYGEIYRSIEKIESGRATHERESLKTRTLWEEKRAVERQTRPTRSRGRDKRCPDSRRT